MRSPEGRDRRVSTSYKLTPGQQRAMSALPTANAIPYSRTFPAPSPRLMPDLREALIYSTDPKRAAGASYLLRLMGLRACCETRPGGLRVVLVQRHLQDLRTQHILGPGGLESLSRGHQDAGIATMGEQSLRFKPPGKGIDGAVFSWYGCHREAEVRQLLDKPFDVLLVDGAEDLPESLFAALRERALSSSHPGRRVIVVADSPGGAWVPRYFPPEGDNATRARFPLDPAQLHPSLSARSAFPTYREWLEQHFAGSFIWSPPASALVNALDQWFSGDFEHLAIFVPSQHGKSTAGPQHAIPYLLRRHARDWCAVVSYASDLAEGHSREARAHFLASGGRLAETKRSAKQWLTQSGGGCWASGVGGGQVGHPASWAFVDDLDRGWLDALNRAERKKKQAWYPGTFRKRESMYAEGGRGLRVCLTATRWDPADTSAFILGLGEQAEETWGILALSAVYDPLVAQGYAKTYPHAIVLPDYRTEPGDPIWPERRDRAAWEKVKKLSGPILWPTEAMQYPGGVEKGGKMEAEWFNRIDRDPAYAGATADETVYSKCVRAWDLAGVEGGGDWTAGAKLGLTKEEGDVIIRHVAAAQLAPVGVKQLIAAIAVLDGPTVTVRIPKDPAVGGKAFAEEIVRYIRQVHGWMGLPVPPIVVESPAVAATSNMTAKEGRAVPFASRAMPPGTNMPGGVSYVAAAWTPAVSDRSPKWVELVGQHAELAEVARRVSPKVGEGQGIERDWQTPTLAEYQSFTGADGRTDDRVDATVDAFDQLYADVEPPVESSHALIPPWRRPRSR